ncbi:MAG TPA: DNA ligase D [Gaiellaceae bacterium]|nr:DNA ligase D [Gaiellaceae bacterium]
MSLDEYRRKRDPKKTKEPFTGSGHDGAPVFVIQRHDARRLHYDFRLERDGVLASWAVPKGIPLEPGVRALAVHVEDHPLDYGSFQGTIPKGQYGAGTVEIWDRGTYDLLEEKKDGGLTVRLHGERLQGTWTLIPAHLDGKEQNWLMVRKRNDADEPAGRNDYKAMLATLTDAIPHGDDWSFEVKWDGYRALGYVRHGNAKLVSRNGNDLTERFAGVARALEHAAHSPNCVVDGEVCALDDQGRPSFSLMQQGRPDTPIVYEVFDVLELDGRTVVDQPLTQRRKLLDGLLDPRDKTVRISAPFEDGDALFAAAQEQHLEGVMAKRDSSRYAEGRRTRDWLKIKTHGEQEFVVVGYTKGEGRRARSFGSLVLAVNEAGTLRWVGNVGTGFTEKTIAELLDALEPLRVDKSPLAVVPKMAKVRAADVVWVKPQIVAEVKFAEWTHDGHLRAPVYLGLRDDKTAPEVRAEKPSRVKFSNLDKVFWPDEEITKGDLIEYYRAVAPVLVPHLRERPFTMRRYPDGAFGKAFFQKDAPSHMPDWIPRLQVEVSTRETPRKRRTISVPIVNEEDALLWMVNMGCIDMNTWYSRVDRLDRPDWVLFDLDPSPDAGFKEAVQVALLVKEALDALGLVSFPKTSSADGMHVLVPIERRYTYDDAREFCEIVAGAIARSHRGLATTEWAKSKRRGVLIDANQNGEGKTVASVYSVRPRPGAPVSTPLRWDEVNDTLDATAFTVDVVLERVRTLGDLFEGVLTTKQRLRTP